MDNEKYMTIGSVVMLKKGIHPVMVIGFCPIITGDDGKQTQYDYFGCVYPEGLLSADDLLAFNHDDIAKVIGMGVSTDEDKNFRKVLKEKIKKLEEGTFDFRTDSRDLYGKLVDDGNANGQQ